MTLPDLKIGLQSFWFNRSTRTKWIIVGIVALILIMI